MSGARVLVVDDEPQILRALEMKLQGAGYAVDTAATAKDALAQAAMRPPEARHQEWRTQAAQTNLAG